MRDPLKFEADFRALMLRHRLPLPLMTIALLDVIAKEIANLDDAWVDMLNNNDAATMRQIRLDLDVMRIMRAKVLKWELMPDLKDRLKRSV